MSNQAPAPGGPPSVCTWVNSGHGKCEGTPTFRVVSRRRAAPHKLIDTVEPFCVRHAITFVNRAVAAGSIALVDYEPIQADQQAGDTRG